MSKEWYPIINYEKCRECGVCVEMCRNQVYDKERMPKPFVINPEMCCHGCHGCGNKCSQGAITYWGDTSGWNPPGTV